VENYPNGQKASTETFQSSPQTILQLLVGTITTFYSTSNTVNLTQDTQRMEMLT